MREREDKGAFSMEITSIFQAQGNEGIEVLLYLEMSGTGCKR